MQFYTFRRSAISYLRSVAGNPIFARVKKYTALDIKLFVNL